MDAGNRLRESLDLADAMARLALLQIRAWREEFHAGESSDADAPIPRRGFILNSLKRPEEVELLREVYGEGFVLLAAYASRDSRRDRLAARIAKSQNKESDQCRHIAERLIDRDDAESGTYGQLLRDTYFRADAFIDATQAPAMDDALRRFVEVVFGHPFETPTRDEFGMQHAYSSALRSADLSRQVGAAICSSDGQVLAVGCNEVPKAGGGLYWGHDDADARDFRFADTDEPNAEMKMTILADILRLLQRERVIPEGVDLDDREIDRIAKRVRDSRLMGITEYGRAVHAEMAAITDAARRGVSIQGATIYSTTFPCHNCAKHIVTSGLMRLVYIEPYPKSQVGRLFPDSIAVDRPATSAQVSFSSFVGFAPNRFPDFFQMRRRTDPDSKKILNWDIMKPEADPRVSGIPAAYLANEVETVEKLKERMLSAGMKFDRKGESA